MEVSVVIPAFNSEKTIESCIQALLSQDFLRDQYDIIIVDDGSNDKTSQLAEKYPVRLIRQRNSGPATARNAGFKAARGRIVAFTDSDCKPERNWLSALVRHFDRADVGGVGGSYKTGNLNSILARIIGYEILERHSRMPKFVDFLGSFNCAFRKDALEKAGGFDESFREASGEDNDLSYRISDLGYKLVFDPKAVVAHEHPNKLIRYLKIQYRRSMWRVKLYNKHPKRVKGDVYAGSSTLIIQPLLYVSSFLTFVLSAFYHSFLWLSLGLFATLLVTYFPITFKLYKKSRDSASILALPVFFLRGAAWVLGLAAGIVKFPRSRSAKHGPSDSMTMTEIKK